MAVPYISQFIPTNTQALQGVLSEYQTAYDQNLARELDIQDKYAAIPTIGIEDTVKKNKLLDQFSSTLGELENKYNYDKASSSYSKELARKISDLRKNDFWTYNERKQQLMAAEQEDKRRLGANYFSAYSPSSATYQNQEAINKYQPMNKQDLYNIVFGKGTEWATSNRKNIVENLKDPRTGQIYAQNLGVQFGAKDEKEVADYLAKNPEWLMDAVKGTPFADYINNPELLNLATTAAMSSMIGKPDVQTVQLPDIDTPTGGSGSKSKPVNLIPVGTLNNPYQTSLQEAGVEGISDLGGTGLFGKPANISPEGAALINLEKNKVFNSPEAQNSFESAKKQIFNVADEKEIAQFGVDPNELLGDEAFNDIVNKKISGKQEYANTWNLLRKAYREKYNKPIDYETDQQLRRYGERINKNIKQFNKGSGEYAGMLSLSAMEDRINESIQKRENVSTAYILDFDSQDSRTDFTKTFSDMLQFTVPMQKEFKNKSEEGSELWDKEALASVRGVLLKPNTAFSILRDAEHTPLIMFNGVDDKGKLVETAVKLDPKKSTSALWTSMAHKANDLTLLLDAEYEDYKILPNTSYNITNDPSMITYMNKKVMSDPETSDIISQLSWGKVNENNVDKYVLQFPNGEQRVLNNKQELIYSVAAIADSTYYSQNQ